MFDQIDNYCERLNAEFWAEPLNAVTNASFLIAALVVAIMLKNRHDIASKTLIGVLTLIGIGSFLFHTFAQIWASIADVLPILLFILCFLYFATRRFLGQTKLISGIVTIGFFPFVAASTWAIMALLGPINGSAAYVSVALLIAIYAAIMWQRNRTTAIGLAIGALILLVSITFRSIDTALCASFPSGTHLFWHLLNGIMLGWMILVLARHPKD